MLEEKICVTTVCSEYRSHRDSGTSSPINPEASSDVLNHFKTRKLQPGVECRTSESTTNTHESRTKPTSDARSELGQRTLQNQHGQTIIGSDDTEEELSDSNDSVFSSDSSIDSILNYSCPSEHLLNDDVASTNETLDLRDIYLGGSCALRTKWRSDIVIPMLEKHNITYHLPQLHSSILHQPNGEFDDGLLSSQNSVDESVPTSSASSLETSSSNDSGISTGQNRSGLRLYTSYNGTRHTNGVNDRRMFHLSLLDSSRVLLFVITNETRSLAPMTLAAHCIGLGYNTVLCVQMLSEGCTIGNDKVSFLNKNYRN